jgi:hypothetical protein
MGSPPPPDAPSLEQQDAVDAEIGFEPSPTGASLCGFGLPSFVFNLTFRIPPFPPFDFPPDFFFFIGLNCDLSNPLDASFGFGGGRVSNSDPEADPEYGEAA